ncbi:MAG: efflux RND transporter periplasmic adaptor subunit [Syntrophales bacterium]|nr:efflux RND transporter periplasmic adaptor subunit [Syntrophales bacterium]
MRKRSPVAGIYLLLVISCMLLLPGCSKKEPTERAEKVMNVRAQPAQRKAFRPFVEAIGTLNPDEEVVVSNEIGGILKSVRVDEGTNVSRGTILAVISDTDYRLEVKRAEAALRQDEATLANTRLEYRRKEALYREELVTKQQFDDVSTRLSLAAAETEKAKATLSLAGERVLKTGISSPLNGVIKEKKVSAGDYVKEGTPLFAIIRVDPLKLNFSVNEQDVGKIKVGQDVSFKVDTIPGREFAGKVNIVYPNLEERTRTLRVEAIVPNRHRLLKPGLFVKVTVYTGEMKDIILVPLTSLRYEEAKTSLFVVEGDRAREKEVKIGRKYGELLEIIEGLKEKEMVVVVGQNNLAEGVKVNVAR